MSGRTSPAGERSEVGRDLRRLGLSYGEIQRYIDVKKSTLATWCRDVTLTSDQKAAIQQRTGSRKGIPRDTNWRRRLEIADIRRTALKEAARLAGDALWVAGVVLYWAEGSKTRNMLELTNSDPRTLRLFIRWVRRYVTPDPRFVLHLHLHEGNDDRAARAFWRRETGLPDARFHKTFFKPAGTGHRKNHLKHGVCKIRVRAASDHWNRVMAWTEWLGTELADASDEFWTGATLSGGPLAQLAAAGAS